MGVDELCGSWNVQPRGRTILSYIKDYNIKLLDSQLQTDWA